MIPLYTQEEFDNAKSRGKLPLQCKCCGGTFLLDKNLIQRAKKGKRKYDFCSKICVYKIREKNISVFCLQCGKEFKKQLLQIKKSKHNFCSRSCSCTYQNTHKTTGTRVSKLEKWLQVKLPVLYPNLEFHFNRKDAINGELDIYIPTLKLAFELNGIFHYEPIFGEKTLERSKNNDNRKYQACLEHGIELCIIDVSKHTYFKESTCIPFLEIIQKIISLKIQSVGLTTV